MPAKINDYPVYSQKDLLDQFAKVSNETEKDIIAYFLSDLTGMSVDKIYEYENEQNRT